MRLGERFYGVTDSKFVVEFDPISLSILGDVKYHDHLDRLTVALGSAHPLPDLEPTHRGCVLGVRPQEVAMMVHEVLIYRLCEDAPTTRVKVAKYHTGSQLAYFHSFGLSPRFAILPLQHITFDMITVMTKGNVKAAFKPYDLGKPTKVVLLPLAQGEKARTFELPGDVYFVHAVNSFETKTTNGSCVIFDSTAYTTNFFSDTLLSDWKNATIRDHSTARGTVSRFTFHTSGPREGEVEQTPLSVPRRSTDFPKINMAFHGKPYCFYYAVEWFHDDEHFSRMAIVRQDVCTGKRSHWYREGSFPSEPTFVQRKQGTGAEDDGVIMFTLLDGASGKTSLMFVDAATMQAVGEAPAPRDAAIGYTTHGQWFEGVGGV